MPFIQALDIKIYYRAFDKEKEITTLDPNRPTMIILHGGFGIVDHQLEVPAWLTFSNQLQVVFLDQRGCGQTEDGDTTHWNVDQFGDDIVNFCHALQIKQPIVAGISAGGYAIFAYATRHPLHPGALILTNTEPVVAPVTKKQAYAALGRRSDRRDFTPFKTLTDEEIKTYADKAGSAAYEYDVNPTLENFATFAKYGYSLISKTTYEFIPPVRQNMLMKAQLGNGYQKFNYLPDLHKIKCPVLWFAGQWDPLHPQSCAEQGAAQLANVDLRVLAAGAPIYQDAPDAFKEAVLTFYVKNFAL